MCMFAWYKCKVERYYYMLYVLMIASGGFFVTLYNTNLFCLLAFDCIILLYTHTHTHGLLLILSSLLLVRICSAVVMSTISIFHRHHCYPPLYHTIFTSIQCHFLACTKVFRLKVSRCCSFFQLSVFFYSRLLAFGSVCARSLFHRICICVLVCTVSSPFLCVYAFKIQYFFSNLIFDKNFKSSTYTNIQERFSVSRLLCMVSFHFAPYVMCLISTVSSSSSSIRSNEVSIVNNTTRLHYIY